MLLTLGNATVEVQVVGRADFGRRKCVACGAAVRDMMLCDSCDERPVPCVCCGRTDAELHISGRCGHCGP